jgi:polysaccharide pyruvyl transferase WcaK-like protein
MDKDRPLFILAGICPYENRGCEAIIRGTVKILRNYFQDPTFLCVSDPRRTDLNQQIRNEYDDAIIYKKINIVQNRFSREWWYQRIFYRYNTRKRQYRLYNEMIPFLDDALAILSVGGDNYSLDYGIPHLYTDLDDVVLERKKPLIIWGASVGPFDKLPDYEKYMIDHLKKITGIFARESRTEDYLARKGITENVYKVADPAFLMDPVEPRGESKKLTIEDSAIGINLSPLMSEYVTGGDMEKWEQIAVKIISNIVKETSRSVYLIPHVTIPGSNDFMFLKKVWSLTEVEIRRKIHLIPPVYNAAETKWIISHMTLFAGARTHATIAAFSSCIPTLSFAYSIKAKGINRDIFGHEEYCLGPDQLTPEIVTARIETMLDSKDQINMQLREIIPQIQKNALKSGIYLKDLTK